MKLSKFFLQNLNQFLIQVPKSKLNYPKLTEPDLYQGKPNGYKTEFVVDVFMAEDDTPDVTDFDAAMQKQLDAIKAGQGRARDACKLNWAQFMELCQAVAQVGYDEVIELNKSKPKKPLMPSEPCVPFHINAEGEHVFKTSSAHKPRLFTAEGQVWGSTPETAERKIFPKSTATVIAHLRPITIPAHAGAKLWLEEVIVHENGSSQGFTPQARFNSNRI